jgi:hypothetical protein
MSCRPSRVRTRALNEPGRCADRPSTRVLPRCQPEAPWSRLAGGGERLRQGLSHELHGQERIKAMIQPPQAPAAALEGAASASHDDSQPQPAGQGVGGAVVQASCRDRFLPLPAGARRTHRLSARSTCLCLDYQKCMGAVTRLRSAGLRLQKKARQTQETLKPPCPPRPPSHGMPGRPATGKSCPFWTIFTGNSGERGDRATAMVH